MPSTVKLASWQLMVTIHLSSLSRVMTPSGIFPTMLANRLADKTIRPGWAFITGMDFRMPKSKL